MSTNPCTWRNLPAVRLDGDGFSAVITLIGGHLASLRRPDEELNPFWQPQWEGRDPGQLEAGDMAELGGPAAAPLLATIVGSNLCCDRFGPPRPGEQRPVHGETCRTMFAVLTEADWDLVLVGRLPQAGLEVHRRLRFAGDAITLATSVRPLDGRERAIEWCEHSNVGGDFLDGVAFTAPLDRVVVSSHRDVGERFATGPIGADVPIAAALAFPAKDDPACGDVLCGRLADAATDWCWSATNARLGRRLSCHFAHADWPWLALWTQHRSRQASPWLGRERVRGMELSTKPIPEAEVPPERRERWLDRPTTCLLPPEGLTKTLVFRWQAI
jgi:hypothetical protein